MENKRTDRWEVAETLRVPVRVAPRLAREPGDEARQGPNLLRRQNCQDPEIKTCVQQCTFVTLDYKCLVFLYLP